MNKNVKGNIEKFSPSIHEGLTSEQVSLRIQQKKTNKTKIVVGKSVGRILLDVSFFFF